MLLSLAMAVAACASVGHEPGASPAARVSRPAIFFSNESDDLVRVYVSDGTHESLLGRVDPLRGACLTLIPPFDRLDTQTLSIIAVPMWSKRNTARNVRLGEAVRSDPWPVHRGARMLWRFVAGKVIADQSGPTAPTLSPDERERLQRCSAS